MGIGVLSLLWISLLNSDYYNGYRNVSYNAGRRGTTSNYSSRRMRNYTADRTTSSLNRRSSSELTRNYSATSRYQSTRIPTTDRSN